MRRDVLWALGFAGTVEAAQAVLAWAADEGAGKAAGEAFATITGARIAGALAQVGQTDNSAPPESGDDDEPVPVVLPEDELPMPNAAQLRRWWERAAPRFAPSTRYLYGRPLSSEALRSALLAGPTWRRRAWSLGLAADGAANLGVPDVYTWARSQQGRA